MAKSSKSESNYASYSSYAKPIHEKPVFHYSIIILVAATLIVSIIALVNTYQLKKVIIPREININDFLKKLTSHDEMKSYAGTNPINVVQINSNNFASLQSQLSGLDTSYIGSFIVQYPDKLVVYDYDNDKIKGTVSLQKLLQSQLPQDLLAKLNKHAELQGLQSQQPIGGQLDAASLATLKQQFPDAYANAKVGDYLLRYQTKLIIYDYKADKIVNSVKLGQ